MIRSVTSAGSHATGRHSTFPRNSPRSSRGREMCVHHLILERCYDMARVRLNGRELGVVWTAPWRVDAAGVLRAKGNVLEIEVANRWRNRLVGDERFRPDAEYGKDGNLLRWPEWLTGGAMRPSTGRTTFASWRHFTAETPLLPSGLLGPVTGDDAGQLKTFNCPHHQNVRSRILWERTVVLHHALT